MSPARLLQLLLDPPGFNRASLAGAAVALAMGPAHAQQVINRPTGAVDVISHELVITPDFAARSLSGRARVRFRASRDGLREVAFSDNSLVIDGASIAGQPAAVARSGGRLVFALPAPLRRGQEGILIVSYHGRPARGVTFTDTSLVTSYWACDWMICSQDDPGDKASFQLTLRLPAGMQSLSLGRPGPTRPDRSGRVLHSWREPRPYSSYLYGFAAGRFDARTVRGGGATLTYLNATGVHHDMDALFGTTGAMVRFLEDKAGVALPSNRYTQLLVPGDEAQEAATYALIGLSNLAPILQDSGNDWVLIHELAHQWWGNLVTCRSWDHFWLNEGMAVFMTAAWKESRFGRAAYDAELQVARTRLARARDVGFDRPLAYAGPYPSLGIRRAVQYSKAALFLDHLRTMLGDTAFWSGLRRYTRRHAGGVVESRDFQRALEESSGRDLGAVFSEWVYGNAG